MRPPLDRDLLGLLVDEGLAAFRVDPHYVIDMTRAGAELKAIHCRESRTEMKLWSERWEHVSHRPSLYS